MEKVEWAAFGIILFWFGLIGAAAFGWISNVVKLFGAATEPLTAMFIIRCLGVPVAPLGVVLGYL